MRVLEIALVVGDLLTLVLLAVPRSRMAEWALCAGLAMALIAVAQLLVEGSRWQMLPAYVATGVLLLAAFVVWRISPVEPAASGWKGLAVALALGLAGLALVVSSGLAIALPMFRFPVPSGPYAVGTVTYDWVDQGRADFGDPAARRELMVQIWYPAEAPAGAPHDTYIQDDMHFGSLPGTLFPGFFSNHLKDVRTNALRSAPIAGQGGRFPVLVFSPGAEGFRQHNTFQLEELVSHGYVVAGIDHPRAAREVVFPDGRRIDFDPKLVNVPRFMSDPDYADGVFNYLAQDVSFALNRIVALNEADPAGILSGRLDVDRMGMLGVSLGGLVAAEACRTDQRLRACLIQDVFVPRDVLAAGVEQPTMWLSSDAASMRQEGWPDWEVELHQSSMQAAYESTRTDGYRVKVPGMFHLNFTDFPYTLATPLAQGLHLIGPIDWRRGHEIVNAYTLAFFDRHLRGQSEPLLEGSSRQFPGIEVESRHH